MIIRFGCDRPGGRPLSSAAAQALLAQDPNSVCEVEGGKGQKLYYMRESEGAQQEKVSELAKGVAEQQAKRDKIEATLKKQEEALGKEAEGTERHDLFSRRVKQQRERFSKARSKLIATTSLYLEAREKLDFFRYAGFSPAEKETLKHLLAPESLTKDDLLQALSVLGKDVKIKIFGGYSAIRIEANSDEGVVIISVDFINKTVEQEALVLYKQGGGKAPKALRDALTFYDKFKFRRLFLEAGLSHGAYVWARTGFNAETETRKKFKDAANRVVQSLTGRKKFMAETPAEMAQIASVHIPKEEIKKDGKFTTLIRERLDDPLYYDRAGNFLVGKAILMGTKWQGYMDLEKESVGRRTLEAYLQAKGV